MVNFARVHVAFLCDGDSLHTSGIAGRMRARMTVAEAEERFAAAEKWDTEATRRVVLDAVDEFLDEVA